MIHGRMLPEPALPRRRSLRLRAYDYSQAGAYFVTICTQDHACLFGEVVDERMQRSGAGEMIASLWDDLPSRFPQIEVDAFVASRTTSTASSCWLMIGRPQGPPLPTVRAV
jgi:hypothetical protein